mmetsp:Transcript_49723/g.82540  ORF Transcript_49723/g.82540 Transcript_49723/m.82540 type:complete len:571 (-) Transcript_49723:554-2266(-)
MRYRIRTPSRFRPQRQQKKSFLLRVASACIFLFLVVVAISYSRKHSGSKGNRTAGGWSSDNKEHANSGNDNFKETSFSKYAAFEEHFPADIRSPLIPEGRFKADWASLVHEYRVPEWYLDAKFGVFIHWGVYSVPAKGNEWYPRRMYLKDDPMYEHHQRTYGPQNSFGYKDFIPRFTASNFNADEWSALFKRAGFKFVVPVAEHHDGFAMYESSLTNWTAAAMGPRRDVIKELADAVRKVGLVFGLSSHRAEHWWFFEGGRQFDSDVKSGDWEGLYGPAQPAKTQPNHSFLSDWLARTCELVDKYKPQIVWFDWWIEEPAFSAYLKHFAAYYYNRGDQWHTDGKGAQGGVAINYKKEAYPLGAGVIDIERGQLASIKAFFWQTDTSVSRNSWGYITDHDYKPVQDLIGDLADIVSKNGALLLNVGPKADGTIPEHEVQMLNDIGKWLEVNGEAIYSTRPWKVFGEGPTEIAEGMFQEKARGYTSSDIRFTRSKQHKNVMYAIVLAWPNESEEQSVLVRTLAKEQVVGIELMGTGPVQFKHMPMGVMVDLPVARPCKHAFALRIELTPHEK